MPLTRLTFILAVFLFVSCKNNDTLFRLLPPGQSGITFNNKIIENDTLNPIDVTNIYNGGGVGVADFNNDGLQDMYLAGNVVPNALYLNKGDLKFDDITKLAGVDGGGRWSRGVSVVDINNDGWQDIYVSVSMDKDVAKRQNLLYINNGVNAEGVPTFTEQAAMYALNDTTHTTMAAFFDYDNDSDLDVYLVVNEILDHDIPSTFRPKITDGSHPSTGRLYRNDFDSTRKHPVFTNITAQAGVTIEGYGHGVNITDINLDGWKDIFVTNDFNSNDLLYINNHDGTFTDKADDYFKHTSANGMGQDVIDINNDGLSDIIELDMNPEDNYRKKMMMGPNSYQLYQNSDYYGYQYQYVRNTLQLNMGPRINQNDSIGDPIFSDVGFFAGIAETDWSWMPLVTDFDNDGFRDIIVTNGFPRDITDHDFIAFRKESFAVASKEFTLSQIPQVKLHNYAFRNNGNVTFSSTTKEWGLLTPTFSNGAAYADLDNDGDLDMIINNINDPAMLYENTANSGNTTHNYLSVELTGDENNRSGIGSWIEIYYDGNKQVYEQNPYRGYLSTIQYHAHFGLGKTTTIDSLVVKWPNGKLQKLTGVTANKKIEVNIKDAATPYSWNNNSTAPNTLFTAITNTAGLNYVHQQDDFVDFNIQKLLPHKFTEYGPALAAGDVDGNGLDDIVAGGSHKQPVTVMLQQHNGSFINKQIVLPVQAAVRWQDMGIALFDVDNDNDLDIYIARGGYESEPLSEAYHDVLLLNDGKGGFTSVAEKLPKHAVSKSCVRAADYDRDGDLDLFVAGRVEPWNYPKPVPAFIYRNDTKQGKIQFTDVTRTVAPTLNNAGLLTDAAWTDFNNDGWQDIIYTGEWMAVRFLQNNGGTFTDVSTQAGTLGKTGWWNSILPADVDNDGDMDYIVSNLGLNSFYRANDKEPVSIYAKDFDGNGNFDAVPTLFLPASQTDPVRREFVAHTRDDMTKQLISFKSKFQNYNSYASATIDKMFTPDELKDALVLKANYFSHSLLKNMGGGKFEMNALPMGAQYVCMNGMIADDFDGDGNLDVLVNGNDYGTEVSVGRYDACNGLMLKGDGKGGFKAMSILQSGWFVPGNGKALVKLRGAGGNTLIAASQNKGAMKLFKVKRQASRVDVKGNDVAAIITYKNGTTQKRELSFGSSFLSQSGRFILVDENIRTVDLVDSKGDKRTILPPVASTIAGR